MKHSPIITSDSASCTCKRMPASFRRNGEPIGAFTVRAFDTWKLHEEIAADGATVQRGLFETQQEMFA